MGRESRRRNIIRTQLEDAREYAVMRQSNRYAIRLLLAIGFAVGAVFAVGVQFLIEVL